jgi:glycosyltransferase involved in cell wall biosynthesis
LNILLVSQFFSTTRGGGENVFSNIAQVLAENDHKVWVITNNIKGEKYPQNKNIKIITVPPILEYKGGLPPSFSDNIQFVINAIRKGKKIIDSEKIDLIHSNNFSPALVGSFLSLMEKKPHITTVFDIFSLYEKDFWKKWARQTDVSYLNAILVPWFEKILFKLRISAIHTISDTSNKDIIEMKTTKPIYNIAPTIREEPSLNCKIIPFQFVYVGRLVFYKNLEVIIKATQIVSSTYPEYKLIIVGDGPHRISLENLIRKNNLEKNILFKGYLSAEEKTRIISESNALLFPSLIEGFGLVILEAFSQKKPVLTSNIPPMSDIVENQKTGYTIDPHDGKKWAEQIIKIIKEPEISQKMGEEGYKVLKEKYNQEIFYQKLISMYQSVL